MTNRECISRLKAIFKEVHADSKFTNKLAYSILLSISKLLIKRDSERLKIMSQSNLFKTLKCVEIIDAPAIDPCCGIKSVCTVKRTKKKLPKIYTDTVGPLISRVLSIDGFTEITGIEPQEFSRLYKNPWNKKKDKKYYFYHDGHLYFPNGSFKMVEIIAYWEEDISNWSECNSDSDSTEDSSCKLFLDQEFNIPGYYEAMMFQMAEQEVRGTYANIPYRGEQIDGNDNAATIQK